MRLVHLKRRPKGDFYLLAKVQRCLIVTCSSAGIHWAKCMDWSLSKVISLTALMSKTCPKCPSQPMRRINLTTRLWGEIIPGELLKGAWLHCDKGHFPSYVLQDVHSKNKLHQSSAKTAQFDHL